ncbi:MAG TPA: sigma 54-interacting transcriptional regulator, partial [Myxococcota bacterium]
MNETGVQREGSIGGEVRSSDRPTGRRRSDRIVGVGQASQLVNDQVMAAARVDLPLLMIGPAGSGKEHIARAVHAWSNRAANPFLVVSCSAVNATLVGREIFGCAAGVYPLLQEAYVGALQRADAGTVLIDDIDKLPDPVRGNLVTAIKQKTFQPEGGAPASAMRARIIATALEKPAHPPLADLPHHTIELRPLRERKEDILPLAAHWLRLAADEIGVKPVGFTSDARDALLAEPWPGNVRELAERVRQAVQLAGDGSISAEALLLAGELEDVPSFKEAKRAFETRYVVGLLR